MSKDTVNISLDELSSMDFSDLKSFVKKLPPEAKEELDKLLMQNADAWIPLPGPQTQAYHSKADILFYGGAAGGGKTDLAVGLAMVEHERSIIYRKEGTQLLGVIDRIAEIRGDTSGYSSQRGEWKFGDGRKIEFGSFPNPGDEKKYQGRPHDLKVFDEVTNMPEYRVKFLMGWMRSNKEGLRSRVLMTGNPPTDSEGYWVIEYFAPWLDPTHPNPAKPGELRWYTTLDGKEVECVNGDPFEHYDKETEQMEVVKPLSRTFIPARVEDNPYYMESGYKSVLQALPEPLRSQMLNGDFSAGMDDNAFQVIPTAWVDAAQKRWVDYETLCKQMNRRPLQDSLGADVAAGGRDETIISARYGTWFAELVSYPGVDNTSGAVTAGMIIKERKDSSVIHIDKVGWGMSAFNWLEENKIQTVGINGANKSHGQAKDSKLRFYNYRAEMWWLMREALDPNKGDGLMLPTCPKLKADLCAPRWSLRTQGILVESKEDIKKRIGRSPDRGDAVCMALINTMKEDSLPWNQAADSETDYDPYDM